MSRILFTHSYFYRFDPKQWETQMPYPPLGTIQAAAVMREAGHQVSLHDTNLSHGPDEIIPWLDQENPDFLVIYDDGFNYLTKMCLTNMREAAFSMAKMARKRGCKVIVSSSDSTDHYQQYLEEGADFVLLGEAEITLKELVERLNEGQPVEDLKGITYRVDGEVKENSRRAVLRDLDSLPFPAWDLINIEDYLKIWKQAHGYFSLNMATTRGCPFKCNWCAKPIYGNRYNSRSPERVTEEIEWLLKEFQPDHFWMCDDIFGLKPGWAQEFNQWVQKRGLSFSYKIQSRVDLLLQEDTIEVLAESGLHEVWVGAESGSQKILDAMDKGTQVEQIYEATRILKKKGVRVAFFLQFGYPGETKEDIDKTINMVLDLMPDNIGISVSYPLPGTKFYENVKSELKEKANWTDSDELALMFQNTYPPQFYKRLHRYVHKVYRRKQGLSNLKKTLIKPWQVNRSQLRSAALTFYYLPTSAVDNYRLNKIEAQK